MSTYETLLLERKGKIGIITFNRPEALNALNRQAFLELSLILDEVAEDKSTRVVIMTGQGKKSFIAGTDVVEMQGMAPDQARDFALLAKRAIDKIENLGKPVIAAVNGFALGGGCEVALACDLRIASENARFGQPEITLGIIPGSGGTASTAYRDFESEGADLYWGNDRCRNGPGDWARQSSHTPFLPVGGG
jgi:enoyl-CoA hydratase